jgi:hypothetical protein
MLLFRRVRRAASQSLLNVKGTERKKPHAEPTEMRPDEVWDQL